MITVEMTVREAIEILHNANANLKERLIKAIEVAAGDANTSLTVHSIPADRKVKAIQALRLNMGWGLKEANDWCKVVIGEMVQTPVRTEKFGQWGVATHHETHYENGKPNTLSASSTVINQLVMSLREIGCKVTTG